MENSNIKNTFYEIKLLNGEKVNLSLTFARLYMLRAKDKALYEKYNRMITKESRDEIDSIFIIYVAYVCTRLDEEHMSFNEFLEVAPFDRAVIGDAILTLLTPSKKKTASPPPFAKRQRK